MEKPTITFAISRTDDGTFGASSSSSPYFCFEAGTEDEVVATAHRALDFYYGGKGRMVATAVQRTPTRLIRSHKLRDEVFTPAAAA